MNDMKKRVENQREQVLDLVVERVHPALVVTMGTAKAPTRDQLRESISGIMEYVDHPDYLDQDYFQSQYGVLLHVKRDANRHWRTFDIFVPATDGMLWYLEKEDS